MAVCGPCGRWIPVLFVVFLIVWCYSVFMVDILVPMYKGGSTVGEDPAQGINVGVVPHDEQRGLVYIVVFNIIFVLAVTSTLRAIFSDPGRIPDSWIVGAEDTEVAQLMPYMHAQETKHDGTRRVCRKSRPNVYKPDRAHFCRMLNRCVLKMDHFCPWCAPPPGAPPMHRTHPT